RSCPSASRAAGARTSSRMSGCGTTFDLAELRELAVRSVEAGMDVVREQRQLGEELDVRVVGAASVYDRYVTAVDDASEAAVLGVLGRAAPPGECVWVVDPLDGTTNFVHGDPFCAVTV